MSKKQKLLKKFTERPPRKDFKWDELVTVMSHLGFELVTGKSSHHRFYNAELDIYTAAVPKPHPGNEVKPFYITEIVKMLRDSEILP